MDFSQVRPNLGQAQLHEVLANDTSASEDHNLATDFTETSGFGSLDDPVVGTALAHAPHYNAISIGQLNCAPDVLYVDLDPISGYCLAVFATGLAIWKQAADQRIFFALPEKHGVIAKFVRPRIESSASTQPHIVLVDTLNGNITYFDSVGQTVIGPDKLDSLPFGCVGKLPLNDAEVVQHVEIVDSSTSVSGLGFVAATSGGHLFWVNLRNELGKVAIKVTKMRHGGGILDKLRSLGAFSQDIVAVRSGNHIGATSYDDFSGAEVAVVNYHGDVTIWKVGAGGLHSLTTEVRTGPRIKSQVDVLYPWSSGSLHAHDATFEDGLIHLLMSFNYFENQSPPTFLVATFRLNFDLVSVRRLLTYESAVSPESTSIMARIHATSNSMLVVIARDAVAMIESPAKFGNRHSNQLPPARWEECLYLKNTVKVLNSKLGYDDSVIIATNDDLISLQICSLNESEPEISTTEARLKQAVFYSSINNPFDLLRWSSWESTPDTEAPKNLALEIANSQSAYIPDQLPSLSAHLRLREQKLLELHSLVSTRDVKEVAQALETAVLLQEHIEITDIDKVALNPVNGVKRSELMAELQHNVMKVPDRLEQMAEATTCPQYPGPSTLREAVANLVLSVLQRCEENNLGMPKWATHGAFQNSLEILTIQATESVDANLLATITDTLCAINAAKNTESSSVTDTLLIKLAEMGSSRAREIAAKYQLYSTLAHLEVDQWLKSKNALTVIEHIALLPAEYTNSVFDTLITDKHSQELVNELAKIYPEKVRRFLCDNALHSVAWALAPTSQESTQELRLAAKSTDSMETRQLYASLYKLSAYYTGGGSIAEAQCELDLVKAHSALTREFQQYQSGTSCLLDHDIEKLQNNEFTREVAVDMYALAPSQAIPESNNNFVDAFKLVDPSDQLRLNLLVQQIIINTNWERVNTEIDRKMKQTLYYHTLRRLPPLYKPLLQNFRDSLVEPEPVAVKKAWDSSIYDKILPELREIASRAASIADKYKVDDLVTSIFENSMDLE